MKRQTTWLVLVALCAAAACTHSVAQISTPSETAERIRGWPGNVTGVVLRNGRVIDLPRTDYVTLIGDSLIVRESQRRPISIDTIRVSDVTHVVTRRVHVGRTIAAAAIATVAVIAIVAALTDDPEPEPPPETSCPFIYVWDGRAYVAVAEPLGGAISAGLQRTDLSELEGFVPADGRYHLVIANEMQEVQYLDAFSLLAVDHPAGTTVVADRAGNVHVTAPLVTPSSALGSAGEDLLPLVAERDERWWSPDRSPATFADGRLRDTITITFPRPARTDARLVLHTRTSRLGANTLKVMLDLWGSEVDHWYGLLDGSPLTRAAHEEWVQREELWVKRVWVREASGWVPQDVAVGGGPYISELQAVSLDLSRVVGETVELRIHPARGYWDIDFVALDTAAASTPRMHELHIAEADSLDGQDARELLRAEDRSYFVMRETGQSIGVIFDAPPVPAGMTRTVFSRSTGYYRIETDRSLPRQAARLDSLWLQPGHAVRLAEQFRAAAQQRRTAAGAP